MALKIPPSYRIPLLIAAALHVVLLVILIVHLPGHSYRLPGPTAKKPIIQASAVSQSKVNVAIRKVQQRRRAKRLARERAKQRALAKKRARIARQKRIAKQKAARIRLRKQRELARKRKLQQQTLARAKAKAKAREKQELMRKLATERKKLQQKMMNSQLKAEQNSIAKLQAAQAMGIIDKYRALILQAISQHWLVPPGVSKKLSAVFLVQLAPGGVVLSVQLVKSSGNAVLDRSAQNAINQASPLPVPKNPAVFDKMRSLRLTVRPETAKWKTLQ